MSPEPGGDVAVSVIVPVYNPGKFVEVCIESLLGQSLPRDRYEMIFVDDGSTDETPARLDELAATEENVKVFHEPASGWSGRPRNVGIDHAVGRYVYFCDHDDWLGPEALERMVSFADDAGADVLIGKMIGHRRGVPHALFRTNEIDATMWNRPLMSSLTPHKLFRRSFLDDHSLRFPEGKRRLEDHVFVVKAYFLASKIAVLSDYPCYHHIRREDDSNAAFQSVDPAVYFGYVREVIDIIEEHTEPGPDRDHLLERPFSHEMMGRLARKRAFGSAPLAYRESLFGEIRKLTLERFPPDFGDRFALVPRVRAGAVRDDRMDLLVDINDRVPQVRGRVVLKSFEWQRDHWRAKVEAEAVFADGSPVAYTPVGGDRWRVDPRLLPTEVQSNHDVRTRELLRGRPTVTAVERASDEEWFVPATFKAELREIPGQDGPARRVVVTGTADFDPATLAGGRPLPDGVWDITVRINAVGVDLKTRLGVDATTPRPISTAAIVGPRPATVIPYLTTSSELLSIDVGQRKHTLLGAMLARPIGPATVADDTLTAPVDLEVAPEAATRTFQLLLLGDDTVVGHCNVAVVATADRTVLRTRTLVTSSIDGVAHVHGPARYAAAARSRAKDTPLRFGTVDVDSEGRIIAADFDASHRQDPVHIPAAYGPSAAVRARRKLGRAKRLVMRGGRR